jgi:hypothetical protein
MCSARSAARGRAVDNDSGLLEPDAGLGDHATAHVRAGEVSTVDVVAPAGDRVIAKSLWMVRAEHRQV